ncbi:IS66-like element accessory protein TnpA [Paralcaligenes ureilyticus]|jgi:transposase|uniref:Transposase n=1 Tax=Paralcaligenes ureilyticus TaxID=627131 RepID=A0A4V6NZP0_9BURK|nr:transposase [Paralcaligenes ureilyticus]TCT09678.1 transposase [Paralcaligenes ureilyticus]
MSTSEVGVSNRKGRPNYPRAYKREVAMAACTPDVSVAKVALAHGLNTNMVFKWRRELRAGVFGDTEGCALMPVTPPPIQAALSGTDQARPEPDDTALEMGGRIEIELNGARVRLHGKVDPIQLRLVLRCLMPV